MTFPFLKHGLEKGEAIIYLSDEQSPRQIVKDMSTFGIDVDRHEKTGALRILDGEEWHVENGTINKELVVKKLMKALSDATKKGFCGLAVSGEPTYFLAITFWIHGWSMRGRFREHSTFLSQMFVVIKRST